MLWHLAGLAATVGITSQLTIGRSITNMRSDQQTFLLTLAAAFAVGAGVNIWWARRRGEHYRVVWTPLVAVVASGLAALALDLMQAPYVSRIIFVGCIALTTIVFGLAHWVRTVGLVAGAVVLLGIVLGMQWSDSALSALVERRLAASPKPSRSASLVETVYLPLSVAYYDNYFPNCDLENEPCDYTHRTGGGLDALAQGYLVAVGEGPLYYFTRDAEGVLTASRLPYTVPLNNAEFATSGESHYGRNKFRVTDILVEEHAGEATLYAAHHYYHKTADCVVVRLSAMRGSSARIASGTLPQQWDTLYETKPCIPRSPGPRLPEFHGEESGGKLARLDASTMLITVGDHSLDGWNSETIAAQDLASAFGKTMAIDLGTGAASVFTFGHRNPQGLYVAKSGDIWLAEHGPQGGDELNHLVRGTNYGWPLVSYGVDYGQRTWPISLTPNDHRGFEEPVYSWVPSIAVSNLIVLEKNRFPYWQGDMLIGSYGDSLLRARIRAGRVVSFEPVRLRSRRGRIRDLLEDRDGNIVLWLDAGGVAFIEPGESMAVANSATDSVRGQTLFAACTGCHALANGVTHGIGPDLAGIVNRSIAGGDGFQYSQALSKVSGRWTEQNLDRFLADPQAFAPGTTMQFSGVRDAASRAQLIAYLKDAKARAGR
jgi:cytochrome c2